LASDLDFAQYVSDQCSGAGLVRTRKMFGEFALYCDDKVVALICDNQLFLKPTEPGRVRLKRVLEGRPYPGAKTYFLIDDELDNRERLTELIRATARALPAPKPKKKKSGREKNA
jgi:DNA transformation protein